MYCLLNLNKTKLYIFATLKEGCAFCRHLQPVFLLGLHAPSIWHKSYHSSTTFPGFTAHSVFMHAECTANA